MPPARWPLRVCVRHVSGDGQPPAGHALHARSGPPAPAPARGGRGRRCPPCGRTERLSG